MKANWVGIDVSWYPTERALLDAYWNQGIIMDAGPPLQPVEPLQGIRYPEPPPPPQAKRVEVPSEEEARQHDTPSKEDGLECRVCLDSTPICVILPCMHQCICCSCARLLAVDKERGQVECPVCKTHVKKIKRVYV